MRFVVFIFLTFYTELIWVWVAKSTSNPQTLLALFKYHAFSPSLPYPLSPCPFILLFLQTLCVCWGGVHTCLGACVCTCAQRPDDYIRCLSSCAPPYLFMCDLQWIFRHLPSAARIAKTPSQAQILLGARICTQALVQKLNLLSHVPNLIIFT